MKIKISKEDTIFSIYIRLRDRRCMRCNRTGTDDAQGRPIVGLQCSHFIGRGHQNTRYDEDNCDALCMGCHSYLETHKPTHYRDWKIKQLGQNRFKDLEDRGKKLLIGGRSKQEKKELVEKYKQKVKELS